MMQELTRDAENMTQCVTAFAIASFTVTLLYVYVALNRDLKSKFRSDSATLALPAVHFVVGPICCTNDASVRFHGNCFRYSFHHPFQGHIGMIMYYEHMKVGTAISAYANIIFINVALLPLGIHSIGRQTRFQGAQISAVHES
jgi:hypothetical protein